MLIIKTDYLTDDMLDALTDLVLDVNEAEGVRYAVPDDADYYALAYKDGSDEVSVPEEVDEDALDPDDLMAVLALYEMGETWNGKEILELSCFTGPAYRRKGCFRALYDCMDEEFSEFAIRFAAYKEYANVEALKSVGAVYDHDEMMMALQLEAFASTDREQPWKADIHIETVETEEGSYEEGTVNTPYGECFFKLYSGRAYIYGILTSDNARRKGCATEMLRQVFEELKSLGITEVTLEVSSANEPAVGLYRKLGFETMDCLSYYMVQDL